MTDDQISLGAAIDRLQATVEERASASPDASYTAKLLADGAPRCAKKLGEEGVEAALAAAIGDRAGLVGEAVDLVYHLLVTLKAAGVSPEEVAAEMDRREGASGLAEKASRK